MHQQYTALFRKQLAIKYETESRAIAHFLTLIICGAYQEIVDDLRILVDRVFRGRFRILCLSCGSLELLHLLIVNGRLQH